MGQSKIQISELYIYIYIYTSHLHREWEFDFCIFLDTGDMEGGKGEIFFVENGEVIIREQFHSCLSLFVNPRILTI